MDHGRVPRLSSTRTRKPLKFFPYAAAATAVVTSLFSFSFPAYAEESFTLQTTQDPDSDPLSSVLSTVFGLFGYPDIEVKHFPFWLFSLIFRALCGVLFTLPHWFFTTPWFLHTFYTLCAIAISGIMIMGVWTGFKKGISQPTTTVKSMIGRLALALTGIGFAPFLLEKGTYYVNQITLAIEKMSFYTMKDTTAFDSAINGVHQTIQLDFWAMLLFDGVLLYQATPILLKAGQRWFDLLILGAVSPLALASFVFDETKQYGAAWWNGLKGIALAQIFQVGFLAFIVLLLFGSKGFANPGDLFVRLLIIAGGFYRMNHPPKMASGGDAGMFRKFDRSYKRYMNHGLKGFKKKKEEGEKE